MLHASFVMILGEIGKVCQEINKILLCFNPLKKINSQSIIMSQAVQLLA